jgi:hypothetical protein
MKLLRVEMENGKIGFESLSGEWRHLGGSALIARIMNQEVSPTADPLGSEMTSSLPLVRWRGRERRNWDAYPSAPRARSPWESKRQIQGARRGKYLIELGYAPLSFGGFPGIIGCLACSSPGTRRNSFLPKNTAA